MTEPAEIRAGEPERPEAAATQMSLLLSAATSVIDEEFKRSERLDSKSRNQISIVGALFAVVQAVVVGLLNGTLEPARGHATSSFVVWLGVAAVAAAIALAVAIAVSYQSWRLRDDPALGLNTIRQYSDAARSGNPAVGAKLIEGYTQIAEGRRANNEERAEALDRAAVACAVATAFGLVELILAFVAAAVR